MHEHLLESLTGRTLGKKAIQNVLVCQSESPLAFALKAPLGPSVTWACTVAVDLGVSWVHEDLGALTKYEFARSEFLVDGKLPAPAM